MEFSLITEPNGNIIKDESGNILIQQKPDNTLRFITPKQAAAIFPTIKFTEPVALPVSSPSVSSEPDNLSPSTSRTCWNRIEIIELISLYKSHQNLFKSTTIKNDKVWDKITTKLPNHTVEQVKNKFKYLKQKYLEQKDNMSDRSTGAGAIKFEYYVEMDEIFGEEPDVKPVSTASNLRGIEHNKISVDEETSCSEEEVAIKKPKPNKSKLTKERNMFENNFKEREIKKDKRHNEVLERQDAALKILETIAKSLCKKSQSDM